MVVTEEQGKAKSKSCGVQYSCGLWSYVQLLSVMQPQNKPLNMYYLQAWLLFNAASRCCCVAVYGGALADVYLAPREWKKGTSSRGRGIKDRALVSQVLKVDCNQLCGNKHHRPSVFYTSVVSSAMRNGWLSVRVWWSCVGVSTAAARSVREVTFVTPAGDLWSFFFFKVQHHQQEIHECFSTPVIIVNR